MSAPLMLEMFETEPGMYIIILNDLIAHNLGRDEALGVVAAALFKDIDQIPYARPIVSRTKAYSKETS